MGRSFPPLLPRRCMVDIVAGKVRAADTRHPMHPDREPLSRTTPWTFYEFLVCPNYETFLERPDDVCRGFNASLAAFQLADIFLNYYRRFDPHRVARWRHPKNFHQHLCNLEPRYATIQSVAFVYKHLYATKGHFEIGSPLALGGVVYRGTEIVSEWGSASGPDIAVRRRDGSTVSLTDALEAVVSRMWPTVLSDEVRP